MRRLGLLPLPCVAGAAFAAIASCGSRTGLIVDELPAASDAATETLQDASEADVTVSEAGAEAEADGPEDASFRDVPGLDLCPDAGATLIYVLTSDGQLYGFYPPTLTFTRIGAVNCPGPSTPFSMAVDRRGIAYSVFLDGHLFRIDTASGACLPTTWIPHPNAFATFGMGYVADTNGPGETLFIADGVVTATRPSSRGLATIDTSTYTSKFVGPLAPPIPGPELTGTADGRLFGFYTNDVGTGSHIVQIDRASGNILTDHALAAGAPNDAYAFAFWGGDFWVFTSPNSVSTVTRYSPMAGSESDVATLPLTIVGAGVSTCAPE